MSDIKTYTPAIEVSNLVVRYPVVNASQGGKRAISAQETLASESTGWGRIQPGKKPMITALDGLSFKLMPGETVAILGMNGSGKSTLLKALSGIIMLDEGSIESSGVPFGILNVKQGLKMEASGHRNIFLRGLVMGQTREAIKEKFEKIKTFSELGPYLDLPLSTYSTGMIMRLTFSVLIAFEPNILLLDEWLGTADTAFQDKATNWLIDYSKGGGTLMLASHSVGLIRRCCNQGMLLDRGKLVVKSDLDKVISAYRSLRD